MSVFKLVENTILFEFRFMVMVDCLLPMRLMSRHLGNCLASSSFQDLRRWGRWKKRAGDEWVCVFRRSSPLTERLEQGTENAASFQDKGHTVFWLTNCKLTTNFIVKCRLLHMGCSLKRERK